MMDPARLARAALEAEAAHRGTRAAALRSKLTTLRRRAARTEAKAAQLEQELQAEQERAGQLHAEFEAELGEVPPDGLECLADPSLLASPTPAAPMGAGAASIRASRELVLCLQRRSEFVRAAFSFKATCAPFPPPSLRFPAASPAELARLLRCAATWPTDADAFAHQVGAELLREEPEAALAAIQHMRVGGRYLVMPALEHAADAAFHATLLPHWMRHHARFVLTHGDVFEAALPLVRRLPDSEIAALCATAETLTTLLLPPCTELVRRMVHAAPVSALAAVVGACREPATLAAASAALVGAAAACRARQRERGRSEAAADLELLEGGVQSAALGFVRGMARTHPAVFVPVVIDGILVCPATAAAFGAVCCREFLPEALRCAVVAGHVALASQLLDRGVPPHRRHMEQAVLNGDEAMALRLLRAGALFDKLPPRCPRYAFPAPLHRQYVPPQQQEDMSVYADVLLLRTAMTNPVAPLHGCVRALLARPRPAAHQEAMCAEAALCAMGLGPEAVAAAICAVHAAALELGVSPAYTLTVMLVGSDEDDAAAEVAYALQPASVLAALLSERHAHTLDACATELLATGRVDQLNALVLDVVQSSPCAAAARQLCGGVALRALARSTETFHSLHLGPSALEVAALDALRAHDMAGVSIVLGHPAGLSLTRSWELVHAACSCPGGMRLLCTAPPLPPLLSDTQWALELPRYMLHGGSSKLRPLRLLRRLVAALRPSPEQCTLLLLGALSVRNGGHMPDERAAAGVSAFVLEMLDAGADPRGVLVHSRLLLLPLQSAAIHGLHDVAAALLRRLPGDALLAGGAACSVAPLFLAARFPHSLRVLELFIATAAPPPAAARVAEAQARQYQPRTCHATLQLLKRWAALRQPPPQMSAACSLWRQ